MLGARAQSRFEVSPFIGYRFGGGIENAAGQDVDFKDGRAYGLALNYSPSQDSDLKFELLWSRQDSGIDLHQLGGVGHVDMTIDEFMVGGVLETSWGRFRPYVTGLVGATLFGPDGYDSDARFVLSLGGGVKFFIFKNLALRADVRGYCNIVDGEGVIISSGGATVAHFSGDTLWQGEVSGGITLAF